MSRLDDIVQYYGISDSRVLRKVAEEFENHKQYYAQFDNIDKRIWAYYEKFINKKLINYKIVNRKS